MRRVVIGDESQLNAVLLEARDFREQTPRSFRCFAIEIECGLLVSSVVLDFVDGRACCGLIHVKENGSAACAPACV